MDTANFYIGLYNAERNEVSFPINVTDSVIDKQIVSMPADQGITGYVLRTKSSLLIADNLTEWRLVHRLNAVRNVCGVYGVKVRTLSILKYTRMQDLEAMAQGRLVVASDVGGHRELVRDGETGFLFPAGDARALAQTIERVLERSADWPQIRGQARHFVETERTWARSVGRYADVYAALSPAFAAERTLSTSRE